FCAVTTISSSAPALAASWAMAWLVARLAAPQPATSISLDRFIVYPPSVQEGPFCGSACFQYTYVLSTQRWLALHRFGRPAKSFGGGQCRSPRGGKKTTQRSG